MGFFSHELPEDSSKDLLIRITFNLKKNSLILNFKKKFNG